MRYPRLLISLLILASLLVDAAVLGISGPRGFKDPPDQMLFFLWALQFSQVSLVSIWLALGRTPGPLRLIGALAVVLAWSWAMSVLGWSDLGRCAVLLMTQMTAVAIPLLIARSLGLCLSHVAGPGATESLPAGRRRWQFSILYLLGWTTAVAILMSTLKSLTADGSFPWNLVLHPVEALFLAGHAALAWAALWAALGQGRPARQLVVFAATLTAAIVLAWQSAFLRSWYFPALYAATAALLLGSLGVLRVAGYRFQSK